MDILTNWRHRRHADTTQRGVHLTFSDNDIASFAKPINRSLDGAAYDPGTRAGLPLVGQGGGVYVADDAASYWQGAAYAAGVCIGGEHEVTALPAAARIIAQNGADHLARVDAAGQFEISLNSGATYSTAAWNALGRGPFHWVATHDGTNQHLWINGRDVDSDVAALDVPAGNLQVGRSGETCRLWCLPSQPDARSRYLTELARRILWQWTPRDVGEGPVGGILTGSASGVGGWTCPLGAATMSFVQRGDRLTLTDTQAVNMNRIDFEFGSRPFFGTIILEYQIRDPATDSPIIGFTPRRGVDPQAAGSQSYWCWIRTAAGPWWRVSMGYENNTAVPIDSADAPWPGPNAGDRCIAVVSRDVDGSVQTWNYVPNPTKGWWWTTATGNHVTTLAEGCITVAPRGSYIERISWLQGAATPHELGIRVP